MTWNQLFEVFDELYREPTISNADIVYAWEQVIAEVLFY